MSKAAGTCETCAWSRWEDEQERVNCGNGHSDYYTDWIQKSHSCGFWESDEKNCGNCGHSEDIFPDQECPYLACDTGETVSRWNCCDYWKEKQREGPTMAMISIRAGGVVTGYEVNDDVAAAFRNMMDAICSNKGKGPWIGFEVEEMD